MSSDFPKQISEAALAPTPPEDLRRRRRLGLAAAVLFYVLLIASFYFLNPHHAAIVLALVPSLLMAALYEIPGGLAGAVVGTLIAATWMARDSGWQWPIDPQSQSALLLTTGSFFGLGVLVGWVSRRERRRSELLLAALAEANQQRQQFLSVLENAPVPVVIGDGGGRVRMANPAALEALGVTPPVALGQDIASLVPDKGLADLIYQATLSNKQTNGQVSGAQKRRLSASVSPVPGVGTVAVMQDISHLIELNERKTEMVRTVSHDLKNPLTAIKGYADLVVKSGDLTERQTVFIEHVRSSAARMISFVNDLLDVAWIEAGMEIRRDLTDLADIAQHVVEEHQTEAASKSLELTVETGDGDARIVGDEIRLHQMIDNLVANAMKYTDKGGKITVHVNRQGDTVICRVQDNGVGIAKEHLDRVFERYFRADQTAEQASGSGLGLSIVKAIVQQHNGSVDVESEGVPGKGTTFVVKLPCVKLRQ